MKHIQSFEDFVNENINESEPTKGTMTDFNLKDFKMFFGRQYGYISHDMKDKDIQKYIDDNKVDHKHKPRTLASVADLFQDYLVSQGLADVQESKTNEAYDIWVKLYDNLCKDFDSVVNKMVMLEDEISGSVSTSEYSKYKKFVTKMQIAVTDYKNLL